MKHLKVIIGLMKEINNNLLKPIVYILTMNILELILKIDHWVYLLKL
jgi:hypothetical protein